MTEATELTGKVAVVTGGSRGIGEAIATTLAQHGADVVITSRKQHALDAAADRIRSVGPSGRVLAVEAHVADPSAAAEVMTVAREQLGPVSILINNAATNPYMGALIDIDQARAEKTTSVNMLAPITWVHAAREAGMAAGGSVVNIASIGGLRIDPNIGYYNATKAALIHITRQLAYELGPEIRVNAVAPGLVKTDLARALWEEQESRISAALPLGRLGTVEDIAQAALFLAGPRASWISGHTLVVDGGAMVNPVIAGE